MATAERRPAAAHPVYLDLFRIRKPLPSIVSILHRVTGAVLLVFGIPFLLWGVERSLASPEAYASLRATLAHPLWKLVLIGLTWAFLHHLCAGIRHLFLDAHIGIELAPARRSSVIVFVVGLALTLVVAAKLW